VINGTDSDPPSYLNPLPDTIGLTSSYRQPNSDVVTIYSLTNSVFQGRIDEYEGLGQENFVVTDPILADRLVDFFDANGGRPILVMVIDDEGRYATLRAVTGISMTAGEAKIKMEPSNSANQPANFKSFLESLGYSFSGPGGPEQLRQTVSGDSFAQVSAVTYFVYTHPDPAQQAEGWLVRLDMPAMVADSLNIDASNPDTIRPFVLAEHVSDFQVALGVDSDESGVVDASEWTRPGAEA